MRVTKQFSDSFINTAVLQIIKHQFRLVGRHRKGELPRDLIPAKHPAVLNISTSWGFACIQELSDAKLQGHDFLKVHLEMSTNSASGSAEIQRQS